jgi:nucleoside-diphosphate-sugar epimerase
VLTRVPSIRNAEAHLGWKPTTDLMTALRRTLDHHLQEPASQAPPRVLASA